MRNKKRCVVNKRKAQGVVPSTVPEPEAQLLWLRDKLAENEAFADLRGGKAFLPLDGLAQEASTPSDFCRRWDSFSASARIMGTLHSKLKRDGWTTALEELRLALRNRDHFLYGERLPDEKMVQSAVVIPDPERAIAVLKWWRGLSREDFELIDHTFEKGWPLSLRGLFSVLPSLEVEANNGRRGLIDAISDSYVEDVIRKFPYCHSSPSYGYHILIDGTDGFRYPLKKLPLARFLDFDSLRRDRVLGDLAGANYSLWDVCVPVRLSDQVWLRVGLHPEKDHAYWRGRVGVFASEGCFNGFGIAVLRDGYPATLEYRRRYGLVSANGRHEPLSPEDDFGFIFQVRQSWE